MIINTKPYRLDYREILALAATSILSLLCGPSTAQNAKPVPKFIDRAEAIRLYWNDAPNHFKSVRAAKPNHNDPDYTVYDLLTVPQGSSVWLDDLYNAQVSAKQARSDLRNGQPQTKLGIFFAKIPNRKEAENLFLQMKAVIQSLPGTVPRGDQYPFYISVWTKGRSNRRMMTFQLGEEPEDGAYVLSLDASFNEDDPLDENM
jgi:hypothetical protein